MRSVHQEQRLAFFGKDKARYFETAMTALGEEEKVYDNILEETLKALKIDMNVFITCQNFLMMDPDAQSEIIKLEMESPVETKVPKDLTKEKVVEILKSVNVRAIELFRKDYEEEGKRQPYVASVLMETIAQDLVRKEYGYKEDEYKSALAQYKVIEDPAIAELLRKQQAEIASLYGGNEEMVNTTPPMAS